MYNTRRNTPQAGPNSSAVGQRRPAVTNNFVSGGQLNTPQKPAQQTRAQQAQQQLQSGITFRSQQQGHQQNVQSAANTPQIATPRVVPQPAKQEAKPVTVPTTPAPAPAVQSANPSVPVSEMTLEQRKALWKTKGGKVNKAERNRRRNMRLSKMLQPKNAVMILNELIKGCTYTVEELPVKVDQNQFRGVVLCEGQEFAGTGRTKSAAKNSAAETALKHLIKTKQFVKKESEDEDKMEVDSQSGDQDSSVMPWSHIASFAVFKLFSAWGEDPSLINKITGQEAVANAQATPKEPKKAKKMPDNPHTMNPLMLMNQMLPGCVWEEVGKSGSPPNVIFTFQVTVGDKRFTGSGSTKKAAKRMAAFAACHEVLNVNYPPDVWSPVC